MLFRGNIVCYICTSKEDKMYFMPHIGINFYFMPHIGFNFVMEALIVAFQLSRTTIHRFFISVLFLQKNKPKLLFLEIHCLDEVHQKLSSISAVMKNEKVDKWVSWFHHNLHLQLPRIKLKERRSMLHQPIVWGEICLLRVYSSSFCVFIRGTCNILFTLKI